MKPDYLVSAWDPALSNNKDAFERYVISRDPEDLELGHGMEPTRFYFRDLTHEEAFGALKIAGEHDRYAAAFRCAVIKVERPGEPSVHKPTTFAPADTKIGFTLKEAEQLSIDIGDQVDIGSVIMRRALALGKVSTLRYPLPLSSLYAWAAMKESRRSAEPTQDDAARNSS